MTATDPVRAAEIDRDTVRPDPGRTREKARSVKPLRILWPYGRRQWGTALTALAFLLSGTVIALAIPALFGVAVDSASVTLDEAAVLEAINQSFLWVFLAAVGLGLVSALRFWFVGRFAERIAADLRRDLYDHMLGLSPRFHSRMRSGEAVSRLTADIGLLETFLGQSLSLGTRTFLNTVGSLAMMLVVSWQLGLVLLLLIPVGILPALYVGRKVRRLSTTAQAWLADAGSEAAEALDAVELVQAYDRRSSRTAVFTRAVEGTYRAAMQRNLARGVMIVLVTTIFFGGVVAVLWFGARQVATGQMTAGALLQMVLYAFFAGSGIGMLSEVYGEVMRAAGAADRAAEILSAEPEVASPARPVAFSAPVRGALSFDRVSFNYGEEGAAALRDVSFTIAPGEFVALVGPSGAGKTTVFRLALRLFDPDAGAVRLDGVSAREASLADWRAAFAYAPQDTALFTGTAAENIAFAEAEAAGPEAELRAAAEAAEAWDFLQSKGGLAAPLGQKGRDLSGGQRQRIALARALHRNAPVLLLDEATSALDSESEALVQKAIQTASEGRTTLAIAHRLATVRRADRILVFDEGRLVEQGRHDALVAEGGLYARLAALQFGAAA